VMKFGVRKLESWGYQMVKKSCRYSFLRFDTIPARDRQTDGHVAIAITRASIASRGKKLIQFYTQIFSNMNSLCGVRSDSSRVVKEAFDVAEPLGPKLQRPELCERSAQLGHDLS